MEPDEAFDAAERALNVLIEAQMRRGQKYILRRVLDDLRSEWLGDGDATVQQIRRMIERRIEELG